MNLFDKMKARNTHYDCQNGWYVVDFGMFWHVVLITNGFIVRSRKVGMVKMSGVNYFDKACTLADNRNIADMFVFEENTYCHIPRIKE